MKIKGVEIRVSQIICLCLYYGIAQYLPTSNSLLGSIVHSKYIRYALCKHIFKKIGKDVNIEKKANFGTGRNIVIGDRSGLGVNCTIPSNTIIGNDVMMGPNCYILANNHAFNSVEIPMIQQGLQSADNIQTIIEDDVWIGRDVLMTPGRHIKKGSIIGARCVLTKNYAAFSIVGGNPSKLIRMRVQNSEIDSIDL